MMTEHEITAKPGDVFALPGNGRDEPPSRVTIAKVTAKQAVDTRGRRWRLSDGRLIGESSGGFRGWSRIRVWTDADTEALEEAERARTYRACLDKLGAANYDWRKLPSKAKLAAVLPLIQAAADAMTTEQEP